MIGAEPADPVQRLGGEIERVAARLRSLPRHRLEAALPPYDSVAAAARALAQRLADAAQGVEERAAVAPLRWRELPVLGVFATGDQLTVTGRDLLASLAGVRPDEPIWTRAGRATAGEVVESCLAALRDLRLAL